MNGRKEGADSNRSGLTRSKLFGAFGHVHNPFSRNSRGAHGVEAYRKHNDMGELGVTDFEAEMTKIKAEIMAQNLIARFQRS